MFKIALTTAFVAVSMSLAMSGGALANGEDDFRDRCQNAGGTFTNGQCRYPDGSIESCQFGEDDWACYRSEPTTPTLQLFKNFGKFIKAPVKTIKVPVGPGPVETHVTVNAVKGKNFGTMHETTTTDTQTTNSSRFSTSNTISKSVITPSVKLNLTTKIAPHTFSR